MPVRLTQEQRARISPHFDANAVEAIANLMDEEQRRWFLGPFGGIPGEAQAQVSSQDRQGLSMIVRHSDPRIQALLEEMWAPFWDQLPSDALDNPDYKFPGRELARKRQQARLEEGGTA